MVEITDSTLNETYNKKVVIILTIVLASSLSLPYFRKLNDVFFPTVHPALLALISGLMVTAFAYLPLRFADPKYAFSSAVLIGLLVAEFSVYGAPFDFPLPVAVSFFFFMFYYGYAEASHLWPQQYQDSLKM